MISDLNQIHILRLIVFFTLLIVSLLVHAESVNSQYEQYWQSRIHLGISNAIIANRISGCAEYKYKKILKRKKGYLVSCLKNGKPRAMYVVTVNKRNKQQRLQSAFARKTVNNKRRYKPDVGIMIGSSIPNVSGLSATSDIGLRVEDIFYVSSVGVIGAELNFTSTILDGDVSTASLSGDWSISTLGVYANYRTRGKVYFKSKLGWLQSSVNIDIAGFEVSGKGTDSSIGVGIGWFNNKRRRSEIELNRVSSDIVFLSGLIMF